MAVMEGHLPIIKYLVTELRMNPNITPLLHPMPTPLHKACQNGDKEMVQFFLSCANCVKNPVDNNGAQPLHYAFYSTEPISLDFIKFLIQNGYHPMCKDFTGMTPFHYAVHRGELEILKFLVDTYKLDPNIPSANGITPLHFSVQAGNYNVVKYLTLEKKCDPLCRENYGNIPAVYAVWYKHYEILKFFINDLGIDPLTKGDTERTLYHEAASIGNMEIWNLLVAAAKGQELMYSVNDEYHRTPLHISFY